MKESHSYQEEEKYLIGSVAKALRILDLFDFGNEEMSVSEIAKRLNLNRSSIYPLLFTLHKFGYLQKNEQSRKYRLGFKLIEKGEVVIAQLEVAKVAEPYLHDLSHNMGESTYLAILEGMDVVYIVCKHPTPQSFPYLMMNSPTGTRAPAHCTALGKVLLAFLEEEELDQLLKNKKLKPLTKNTITDPQVLKEHLAEVRGKGFAVDNEEFVEGGICASAPIKDHTGEVAAAISIFTPKVRASGERFKELIRKTKDTANKISYELGART